eukprot:327780-Pelagomonas_calceolata.AAC.4
MLGNIARFCLHAYTLSVETTLWQEHTSECDRCDQGGLQDERHALFLCSCNPMRLLRGILAHMFSDFPSTYRIFLDESGAVKYTQASSEDIFHLLQKQIYEIYCFISELTDISRVAGKIEEAEQPNYLAEGQIP